MLERQGSKRLDALELPTTAAVRDLARAKASFRLRDSESKKTRVRRMKDALSRVLEAQQAKWMTMRGHPEKPPELPESDKQLIRECFAMLDADGSGSLEADELTEAFAAVGMRVSARAVQSMLDEIDADGNGALELDEFESIMGRMMLQASGGADAAYVEPSKLSMGQNINFADAMQAYRRKKLLSDFIEGGDARTRIIEQSKTLIQKVYHQQEVVKVKNVVAMENVLAAAASPAFTTENKVAFRWKSAGRTRTRDPPTVEGVTALRKKEQQRLVRRWATFERQIEGGRDIPAVVLQAAAASIPGSTLGAAPGRTRYRDGHERDLYDPMTGLPGPGVRLKIDDAFRMTEAAFREMLRPPSLIEDLERAQREAEGRARLEEELAAVGAVDSILGAKSGGRGAGAGSRQPSRIALAAAAAGGGPSPGPPQLPPGGLGSKSEGGALGGRGAAAQGRDRATSRLAVSSTSAGGGRSPLAGGQGSEGPLASASASASASPYGGKSPLGPTKSSHGSSGGDRAGGGTIGYGGPGRPNFGVAAPASPAALPQSISRAPVPLPVVPPAPASPAPIPAPIPAQPSPSPAQIGTLAAVPVPTWALSRLASSSGLGFGPPLIGPETHAPLPSPPPAPEISSSTAYSYEPSGNTKSRGGPGAGPSRSGNALGSGGQGGPGAGNGGRNPAGFPQWRPEKPDALFNGFVSQALTPEASSHSVFPAPSDPPGPPRPHIFGSPYSSSALGARPGPGSPRGALSAQHMAITEKPGQAHTAAAAAAQPSPASKFKPRSASFQHASPSRAHPYPGVLSARARGASGAAGGAAVSPRRIALPSSSLRYNMAAGDQFPPLVVSRSPLAMPPTEGQGYGAHFFAMTPLGTEKSRQFQTDSQGSLRAPVRGAAQESTSVSPRAASPPRNVGHGHVTPRTSERFAADNCLTPQAHVFHGGLHVHAPHGQPPASPAPLDRH